MSVKIIFGAFSFGSHPEGEDQKYLDILTEHGVKDLDTAHIYEGSEKGLGDIGAPAKFIIHTKSPGFRPGALSKESILAAAEQSFKLLKTDSVETYFLHSPDPDTPIEEIAEAIQELYKAGRFKHFGLSNFKADHVRAIYDYAVSKDFVRPTVYQGNYNPIARHSETNLFPVLRELKIAFYAYSPLAGGFLVKSAETIRSGKGEGRWDLDSFLGKLYHGLYNKPALIQALTTWEAIAQDAGVSKAALAYRFVTYHSSLNAEYNDGIIIGASSTHQLEQTLKSIKDGPLDPAIVKKVDEVWEQVKHEAPVDNHSGSLVESPT